MSYEGRQFVVCVIGHVSVFDVYNLNAEVCPICKEKFEWVCDVDDTNCDGVEPKFIIKTQAEYCTCKCGNKHEIKEETVVPDHMHSSWRRLK